MKKAISLTTIPGDSLTLLTTDILVVEPYSSNYRVVYKDPQNDIRSAIVTDSLDYIQSQSECLFEVEDGVYLSVHHTEFVSTRGSGSAVGYKTKTFTSNDTKADVVDRINAANGGYLPLPGNSGEFLTTDGTTASWASVVGAATESGTSLRIGTGSTFTGTTRNTVLGQSSQGGLQDNVVIGYNSKLPSNQSFSTLIGNNLNSGAGNFGSLVLIGNSITPGASGQIIITGGSMSGVTFPGGKMTYIGTSPTFTGGALSNSTIIGHTITLTDPNTGQNTLVGNNVSATVDPTYGVSGGGQTITGYFAKGGAWRATVNGSYAQGLGVSTTVMGYGAYANKPHGAVIGRGGYNDVQNGMLFYSGNIGGTYHFGGVASAWTNPAMPGTEVVDNSASLNAGTFVTKLYGTSGRDANAVPTLTDVRGGYFRFVGGPSTGTAKGGHLQFATSPASGVSSNTENTEVVAAEIDAEAYSAGTIETRFLLLDLSDGTVKRVSFGADDSGGTGYKVLRVAN